MLKWPYMLQWGVSCPVIVNAYVILVVDDILYRRNSAEGRVG